MALGGGTALKSLSWVLRLLQFLCTALILALCSWWLAVLSNHKLHIANYLRAVEGISGAGVLFTIFALILVCCVGGVAILSFIAMLLDLAFAGAFIYVAWALRGGANSCNGHVNTPLGSGNTADGTRVADGKSGVLHLPKLSTTCRTETAAFSVAIIACFLFLLSIPLEIALMRHHKKEKAFGPSPNNGYTAGSPRRKFWQRKPKYRDAEFGASEKPDTLPAHQTPADFRTSYATESTAVGHEPTYNKYENTNMTGAAAPQTTGTTHGYQTKTTTSTGGYTPYRSENSGTY